MVLDNSFRSFMFRTINTVMLTGFAILCLIPIVHILAVSFSDRASAVGGFVTFFPINFTTASYEKVFSAGAFINGFRVSVIRTLLGTAITMLVTILTAYPLSRNSKEFRGREVFIWMMLFAMVFNGGLIPFYLVVRNLGMINSIWSLILPFTFSIWNVIILVNFFRETPKELEDAAFIDGANHWQNLWYVYLPLAVPALATLMLFSAVFHWNEFFFGLIFMADGKNIPLQSYLRQVVILRDMSSIISDPTQFAKFSDQSVRAATIFVTTVPILLVYPFVQRYFVTGIRLGAVKG